MKTPLKYFPLVLLGALEVQAFPQPSRKSSSSTFNAKDQYVSTTGLHEWRAPVPLDARGPCPGLNAMANHGYLPRSGFATVPEFIHACKTVFRMGTDLATILAVYGGALDGVAAGWSIASPLPHLGIGGSHNNYESDSSPIRGDLEQYGSNTELIMSQFHELYDMQPDADTANYDMEVLRKFRGIRFQESIAKNPNFYYSPFSGAVVTQAAFSFIYRFMSNKSAEYPEGRLDKDVLKSFMSVQGPENNLEFVRGNERIPSNWFTRPKSDPYNIAYFGKDIDYLAATQPEIAMGGCNQGKVNSFVKINVTAMSNGKFSEKQAAQNPLCFGLKFALDDAPDLGVVNSALEELVLPIENLLGCVTVPSLNTTVAKACPGYSLYGGPTAKVAKGAIQN